MFNQLKRVLRGSPSSTVRNWRETFGADRPKIVALLALAGSGSHFVLHRLHGHPAILGLQERTLSTELKLYFNSGIYPIAKLSERQLSPKKTSLEHVKFVALNKPHLPFVAYHFPFERQNIHLIQLFRNPVALYYSWQRGWDEIAKRDYKLTESDRNKTLDWLGRQLLYGIAAFGHWQDPGLDMVQSLESFASQLDDNLQATFQKLGLEVFGKDQLTRLERCENCNTLLVKKVPTGGKHEALYCPKCARFYSGPGGYNYIRVSTPADLASWKQKARADEVQSYFAHLFGQAFMDYYVDEKYLLVDGRQKFQELFKGLVDRIVKK
jgi:hypothetical protein